MGYIGGRPDGTLSQEKYYTETEVRERERSAWIAAKMDRKFRDNTQYDAAKAKAIASALRRYGGEA